jgi:hypothetical protein
MNSTSISETTTSIAFTNKAADLINRRQISAEQRETFLAVLEKTAGTTPSEAKVALKSLTAEESEAVRRIHGLADPYYINGLNDEGAYNLLCQPGSGKDLNNDGLLQIGAGLMYSFPPPNAPEEVQQVWEKATAGKSDGEKLMLQMAFAPMEIAANIRYNARREAVGIISPTEPGYTNIYAQSGFTYKGLVNKYLEYLDWAKSSMPPENYRLHHQFALDFKNALEQY